MGDSLIRADDRIQHLDSRFTGLLAKGVVHHREWDRLLGTISELQGELKRLDDRIRSCEVDVTANKARMSGMNGMHGRHPSM